GMAAWKRRNASSTSAGVHWGSAPAAALRSAAARVFGPLTAAALPARALFRLCRTVRSAAFLGEALGPAFLAFLAFLGVLRAMLPLYCSACRPTTTGTRNPRSFRRC